MYTFIYRIQKTIIILEVLTGNWGQIHELMPKYHVLTLVHKGTTCHVVYLHINFSKNVGMGQMKGKKIISEM